MITNNRLIIAAAGSRKTTTLIEEALSVSDRNILLTTYTNASEKDIRRKFIQMNKCIPENVTIQTWYSFLLQHGVKPYQHYLYKDKITGFQFVNSPSASHVRENNIKKHYFTSDGKIYSDKISKFLVKCNEASGGKIISRLAKIYPIIFIDELQDLANYDLEFIELLLHSTINCLLVCDPRQGTFSTANLAKNKQFKRSNIVNFFNRKELNITIDTSLRVNYRSVENICALSNRLYPKLEKSISGNKEENAHQGIFFVKPKDVDSYLELYKPVQLRNDKKKLVNINYPYINFGASKGLTFDRVLIYPTTPIINWLLNNKELSQISKARLYVAITRARFSVAFVYDFNDDVITEGIENYNK